MHDKQGVAESYGFLREKRTGASARCEGWIFSTYQSAARHGDSVRAMLPLGPQEERPDEAAPLRQLSERGHVRKHIRMVGADVASSHGSTAKHANLMSPTRNIECNRMQANMDGNSARVCSISYNLKRRRLQLLRRRDGGPPRLHRPALPDLGPVGPRGRVHAPTGSDKQLITAAGLLVSFANLPQRTSTLVDLLIKTELPLTAHDS